MFTVLVFIALLLSFCSGVVLLLAAVRLNAEDPWWPLLLGTGTRSIPKTDRLGIIERLGTIEDNWRHPILLCAREQEHDPALLAAIEQALEEPAG